MKKYMSFFQISFIQGLQYRAAAIGGIITQFAWGALGILTYKAFYESNPNSFPMEIQSLSTYLWLQQAFLSMFVVWLVRNDIFESIENGNIAYELSKPLNLYTLWFVKTAASRLSKVVLRCLPILFVAFFLPEPYGLKLPKNGVSFIWFLVTMVFGLVVVVAYCMLVYIVTFYSINSAGIRAVSSSVLEFLSGAIIPIPLLPSGVRNILELLPFASMQNIPLRIYSGNLAGEAMYRMVGIQVFWMVALVSLGRWWMSQSLKRVVVQGG